MQGAGASTKSMCSYESHYRSSPDMPGLPASPGLSHGTPQSRYRSDQCRDRSVQTPGRRRAGWLSRLGAAIGCKGKWMKERPRAKARACSFLTSPGTVSKSSRSRFRMVLVPRSCNQRNPSSLRRALPGTTTRKCSTGSAGGLRATMTATHHCRRGAKSSRGESTFKHTFRLARCKTLCQPSSVVAEAWTLPLTVPRCTTGPVYDSI
jgi:hypothetical protein